MDPLLLHEVLLAADGNKADVLTFVESTCLYQSVSSKHSKSLKPFLGRVISKLNEPLTRSEGLMLLSSVVQQPSSQCFDENYQTWLQHLKKITLTDADIRHRCLAIQIFGEVLQCASKYPEQRRYMTSEFIPPFLNHLLDLEEMYDLVVANGLLTILRSTPGPCHRHSFQIQKRLLEMLSTKDRRVVEASSSCVALLPYIYVTGEKGKTPSASWCDFYRKCCSSLHLELNTLYENVELEQPGISPDQALPFPPMSPRLDATLVFSDAYHRAMSIFSCIQKLLRTGTDCTVSIPIEETLTLVKRVTKVTSMTMKSHGMCEGPAIILYSVLPMFHREALKILENLMLSCRRHLLLHDQTVLNVVLHTLQWTSAHQSLLENKQSLSLLRGAAYELLTTWLNIVGSASDFSHYGDAIVGQLLKDIADDQTRVEHVSTKVLHSSYCAPKVKRQKIGESLLQIQQKDAVPRINFDACYQSVKCMRVIMHAVFEDLKSATVKELTSCVIATLLKIQRRDEVTVVLGYDTRRHVGLLKLLMAMVLVPALSSQVLLSQSLYIFSCSRMDASPEVSNACLQGLAMCRSIIDPIRRSLSSHPILEVVQAERMDIDNESYASNDVQSLTVQWNASPALADQSDDDVRPTLRANITDSVLSEDSVQKETSSVLQLNCNGTSPSTLVISSDTSDGNSSDDKEMCTSPKTVVGVDDLKSVKEVVHDAKVATPLEDQVKEVVHDAKVANPLEDQVKEEIQSLENGDLEDLEPNSLNVMLKTFVNIAPDESDLS